MAFALHGKIAPNNIKNSDPVKENDIYFFKNQKLIIFLKGYCDRNHVNPIPKSLNSLLLK